MNSLFLIIFAPILRVWVRMAATGKEPSADQVWYLCSSRWVLRS